MSFCALLQKKSPATPAEYKKTDEPQPDVKEEEEQEEEEEKVEEAEKSGPGLCKYIHVFYYFFLFFFNI